MQCSLLNAEERQLRGEKAHAGIGVACSTCTVTMSREARGEEEEGGGREKMHKVNDEITLRKRRRTLRAFNERERERERILRTLCP